MRSLWPLAVLLAEVLAFYRQILFVPGHVIPWDLRYYHFSIASQIARSFQQGELPLWDPHPYCGFPLYADLTAQVFYPPAVLSILLSNWTGGRHLLYFLELQVVAHVFLAGALAYLLLRRLGLNRASALVGGTVFQLGPFFASQTQHLGAIGGAAWLPLAWLGVTALSRGFTWRWLAGLALAFALSFLAGFPQVTAVVIGSSFLLAAVLIMMRKADAVLLASVAAAVIWSLLLSAIQLLPTLELTRNSVAAIRTAWMGTGGGVPVQALVSLIVPNSFHVFEYRAAAWSYPWNPTFLYLYCGAAGLTLALFGAVRARVWPYLVSTVAFTLWMLGDNTPVGRLLFPLLPGLIRSSLYAEFAMAAFSLGVALLAGYGAHRLLAKRGVAVRAAFVLLVAADLIAVSSSRPMNTASLRDEPGMTFDQIAGVREIPATLRALANTTTPPARIDVVRGPAVLMACASIVDVPTANGDNAFALARLMRARLAFCDGQPWGRYYEPSRLDSPVLDLMNVRHLVSSGPIDSPRLRKVAELPGMQIYENDRALPRFFLVSRIARARDLQAASAALRSPSFDPARIAIVEGVTPFEPSAAGRVSVLRYGAREIELAVDANGPSFLVTSEAWYPGWRAWIDGSEQALALTNVAFRGLAAPAGHHVVRMRFEPRLLWWSALLTLVALLPAAAVVGHALVRARPAIIDTQG